MSSKRLSTVYGVALHGAYSGRCSYAGREVDAPAHDAPPVNFGNPPVVEVALGVQFAQPITTDARTLGQFWPLIQAEYPQLQQQGPLPPQIEEFGIPPQQPTIELLTEQPSPRHWFMTAASDRLVQVQPDRMLFNWRKTTPQADYPRYGELQPQFREHLERLLGLQGGPGEDEAQPTWVEVTYVNQVEADNPGQERLPLSDILTVVTKSAETASLPPLEQTALNQQYLIKDGAEPVGRLHLNAVPGFRTMDGVSVYTITLVARLKSPETSLSSAFSALDRGRAVVTEGFRDLTEPSMHERWEFKG